MQKRIDTSRTTARLVRGARIGDRESFDGLFARVAGRAQIYARLRLEGSGLERLSPRELVRDIHLTAYRTFPRVRYEGDEAFLVWICRIIENRIAALAHARVPVNGASRGAPPIR